MSFPSKFGKYVLLERVNVGGMAEVFKGKTFGVAGFERILAIKRILPNLVEDDEFIRMFIDEARIAVQLNHANIVQIYELGKHGEHYYIAMEYIASRDLRGILDRLRSSGQLMPIPQAAYITAKVAEGLDYAHKRKDPQGNPMNIIHRDVSPQNILVGYEGEVKVIDFGIAKAANRASKTQAGVLKGKFGYMSPEQVRGLPIDRRSDIFAVGVLLYEMLTGERLFIGESDFSTLERVRNAEVIPPTSFNKKISPQLEQIVLKTLAREVEDRYQWASELAHDLQAFVNDQAGAFNARRLSMSMKEVYSAEVNAERAKLEDFLRINPDDVKEKGAPQQSSVLPLPQRQVQVPVPSLSASAKNRPAPAPQQSADDDDGAGEFGEDKTFVIEASAAGMALGQQPTDPNLSGKASALSKQQTAPPQKMITDASREDEDVSLYGGNQDSEEDDARTLVGAENPFAAGAPPPQPQPKKPTPPPASSPRSIKPQKPDAPTRPLQPGDLGSLVDEPMVPPTPAQRSMSQPAAPRPSPPAPSMSPSMSPSSAAFDPVMAAMMEDDGGASVTAPDPSSFGAPRPGVDVTGPSLQQPNQLMTQEANPFAATPMTPVAPPDVVMSAEAPVNWKPLIAALGGSGALFLSAIVFFAIRLVGSGESSPAELVLSPVGAPAPSALTVVLDGQEVAKALPATVPLSSGEHTLEISGPGMMKVTRALNGTGGTLRQPVLIISDGSAPPATDPTPTPTPTPTKTEPLATNTAPPPVEGGWRLSLAAVAEDGVPVVGAEILVNGLPLGTTPFEGELDGSLENISLKIRKDGFTTNEVELKRAGRAVVGPATVSLKRATTTAGAEPTPTDPTPTPTPTPPADPTPTKTEPEPTKVALAEVKEPPKSDPPKSDPPPKAEPKNETPKTETPKVEAPKPPKQVAEIQLGTSPYAETTIDGRKYGSTPFFGPRKLTLPVGTHKVEFFDKQNNKKYRYQIKIKAPDPNNKVVIQFLKNEPPKVEGQVELKKLD